MSMVQPPRYYYFFCTACDQGFYYGYISLPQTPVLHKDCKGIIERCYVLYTRRVGSDILGEPVPQTYLPLRDNVEFPGGVE